MACFRLNFFSAQCRVKFDSVFRCDRWKVELISTFLISSCLHRLWRWNIQSVPKRPQNSDAGESPKREYNFKSTCYLQCYVIVFPKMVLSSGCFWTLKIRGFPENSDQAVGIHTDKLDRKGSRLRYGLVDGHRCFGGTCWLKLQGRSVVEPARSHGTTSQQPTDFILFPWELQITYLCLMTARLEKRGAECVTKDSDCATGWTKNGSGKDRVFESKS